MGNLHDRQATRGIQNPIPTKVELWAWNGSTNTLEKVTLDALNHFATNDIDKVDSTTFYEGLEDSNGYWQVVKNVTDGNQTSMRFATQKNNISITNYSDAWTNRATLTFDTYSVAF